MAAKGEDGETDNLEEAAETDQQNKKKKRNIIHGIIKAPGKVANVLKSNRKVVPEDGTSKGEDTKRTALPTEGASRLTCSDSSSLDVSSHQEMPPLVEEQSISQRKHSTEFPLHVSSHVGSSPHSRTPSSPATTDSVHSIPSHSQTHDFLPLDQEVTVSSFVWFCRSKGFMFGTS